MTMSTSSPEPSHTVASALRLASPLGIERFDAQLLLGHLLGKGRAWLIAHDDEVLPPEIAQRYQNLLERLADHEPLAYLLGHKEFFGLSLSVAPGVLVPRADTETLVDWALSLMPPEAAGHQVLDLGTGSGAIALALQQQRPQAQVTAVDASPTALSIAQANAARLQLPVRFAQGSWLQAVPGEVFDLIVSNPPYIAEGDAHLAALVHEPIEALTAGPDGLSDIRQIVTDARAHLRPGGWLLLEHGHDQHEAVAALLREAGYAHVSARFDLAGHARCTGAQTLSG
jgi:release factor glutamine methyltransferase